MIDQRTRDFRELVKRKGRGLRTLPYDVLVNYAPKDETVEMGGRAGKISVIVEPCSAERVRVVVQGFLDGRVIASVKSVALDGFYKHRDGSVIEMHDEDFYGYD